MLAAKRDGNSHTARTRRTLQRTECAGIINQGECDVSVALFSFLENYPLASITSLMSVVIIIVFLTTSADSAALVIDLLSRHADERSHTGQRVFWTLLLGA